MDHEGNQLAAVLGVLSVPTRMRIVRLLKGRQFCVTALASRLGITQGAVSQHLRIMREAGLVVDDRRGYYVHYRLNEQTLAAWREEITRLLDPSPPGPTGGKGTVKWAAARRRKTTAGTPGR